MAMPNYAVKEEGNYHIIDLSVGLGTLCNISLDQTVSYYEDIPEGLLRCNVCGKVRDEYVYFEGRNITRFQASLLLSNLLGYVSFLQIRDSEDFQYKSNVKFYEALRRAAELEHILGLVSAG